MFLFSGGSTESRYFKDNCSSSDEEIQDNTEDTDTCSNKCKGYRISETPNLESNSGNTSNDITACKKPYELERSNISVNVIPRAKTKSVGRIDKARIDICGNTRHSKIPGRVWERRFVNKPRKSASSNFSTPENAPLLHPELLKAAVINDSISCGKCEDVCKCNRFITKSLRNPEMALNSLSQIDRFARIIFPLSFFLLNVAYWFIYLKHSERISLTFESS